MSKFEISSTRNDTTKEKFNVRVGDTLVGYIEKDKSVGPEYKYHAVLDINDGSIGLSTLAQGHGKTAINALRDAITRPRIMAEKYLAALARLEKELFD